MVEISRKKPLEKNRVEPHIEQAVVNMAYDYPAYGQHRVANELNRQGIMISGSGVRSVWLHPYILIINFQRLMIPN